jgi:glycosyltransferase involved in cell wall biosynthesis
VPSWPGVTILIAHKNDSATLIDNLTALTTQDYPEFEVLIIDDHSQPDEKQALLMAISAFPVIRLIDAEGSGKKAAIETGIRNAKYDGIVCTDADCQPVSDLWISKMESRRRGNHLVLGYSPYKKEDGWLNKLIRFETVMTGIQYLSWASTGKPYMGVGRNLMYSKASFLRLQPFKRNHQIPYGDDDFLVQAMDEVPVVICIDKVAHVISNPPATMQSWLDQKHRHLSAATFYKKGAWLKPGLFGMALIVQWVIIPFLILNSYWLNWLPVFFIGLLIRWISFSTWTKKLGDSDLNSVYPFMEFMYALYLFCMGIFTALKRRKTWN